MGSAPLNLANENWGALTAAVDTNTQLLTKIKQVRLFTKALQDKDLEKIAIKSWQDYN